MSEFAAPASKSNGLPAVTVVKFKARESGYFRGFMALSIPPGILINDCKLFQKGAERWVKLPDREYTKKDGSKAYTPIVELASLRIPVSAVLEQMQEQAHG